MGMSGDTALIQAKRYVDKTLKGQGALKGQDGFSPIIEENADNTDKIYKLDITTADSTFTTPNLRGKDGEGSGGGEENIIDSISVNGVNVAPDENKNVDITVPSIDGLAKTEDIPTKVSELTNDSGYLTEHQDISGKVDKVEGKSLISDTEIARLASVDNYDDTDIRTELANKADATSIPSKVSELTNDSNYQTAEQVNSTVTTEISKVVADAPEDLNTLKEMSDWIAGHEDDASAMNSAISDNKTAITALQTGKADKSEIPTELPANGGNASTVNGHTVNSDVPENAVFTDTTYSDATQIEHGLMSVDDKKKLDSMGDNVKQDIANAVNGIKVGGRNLLLNSDFSRGETKCWQTSSRASIVKEGRNGSYCFKQVGALNNTCTSNNLLYNDDRRWIETSPGEVFTFSGWYKVKDYVAGTTNNFVCPYVEYRKPNQEWISETNIMDIKADATDWTYVTASFKVPENLDIKYLGFCLYARDYTGTVWWDEVKLERGNKVNDWTPAPEDVEYEIENVRKEITVNLLKPTLATTMQNGVTCTNNGDGTYTLNGTATKGFGFNIAGSSEEAIGLILEKDTKVIETNVSKDGFILSVYCTDSSIYYSNKIIPAGKIIRNVYIWIESGITFDNFLIKPMLTTNLNATYDDFVPYTGDGETLASDVAEIKNDLGGLSFSASGTTLTITDGTNTWTLGAN